MDKKEGWRLYDVVELLALQSWSNFFFIKGQIINLGENQKRLWISVKYSDKIVTIVLESKEGSRETKGWKSNSFFSTKNIVVEMMTIFSIIKIDLHVLGNISQGKIDPVKNVKNQSILLRLTETF